MNALIFREIEIEVRLSLTLGGFATDLRNRSEEPLKRFFRLKQKEICHSSRGKELVLTTTQDDEQSFPPSWEGASREAATAQAAHVFVSLQDRAHRSSIVYGT